MQALALIALLLASVAQAAPYRPATDAEIVERLPAGRPSAEQRRQAIQLREQMAATPAQRDAALPQALALAHAAVLRARAAGDPRELGQAQALLAAWWDLPTPPPAVRLLRAYVAQYQHRFDVALLDLDALLKDSRAPTQLRAQAELSRATLLQLRGRWTEARGSCERLAADLVSGPEVPQLGQICLAELDSLSGQTDAAETQLARIARQPQAPQAWLQLLRGELAERRGDVRAEALYRQSLQAEPSIYTRAALADWLLARQRWQDAASVLLAHGDARDPTPARLPDALLLRLVIAWQGSANVQATDARKELRGRFDAAAQRGDTSHSRELARWFLDIEPDPHQALKQALMNWEQQREPADALLLLRAASASGAPAALAAQGRQSLAQFQRQTGFSDQRWQRYEVATR